jgi:hypothetical protein
MEEEGDVEENDMDVRSLVGVEMKLIEMRVVCGSKNKRSQKCYRYRYGEGSTCHKESG